MNVGGAFAGAAASSPGSGGGSVMTSTSVGGTITSADLKGPLAGKDVSDLIRLIEDGNAYVNVHTYTSEFKRRNPWSIKIIIYLDAPNEGAED